MADLTNTVCWIPFAPDIRGNRELERPFYFELNASMSKEELKALEAELTKPIVVAPELSADGGTPEERAAYVEQVRAEMVQRYAQQLAPHVRFGEEPLHFNGQRVDQLATYLDLVSSKLAGTRAFFEPYRALFQANTLGPDASFFSGRLSGGFSSMAKRNAGKGNGQTVAR